MFVFVTNRAIPATNNGSGRALRPCVTFHKSPMAFAPSGVPAFMPTSDSSSRRRAITALEAIRLTLAGKPLATAP
ncbi:MAG: hypothetical protein M3Z96_12290 [Pseudomonadota bacterium]|nr:hypothetical protein [Pseudomonadota bacterium]